MFSRPEAPPPPGRFCICIPKARFGGPFSCPDGPVSKHASAQIREAVHQLGRIAPATNQSTAYYRICQDLIAIAQTLESPIAPKVRAVQAPTRGRFSPGLTRVGRQLVQVERRSRKAA